MTRHKQARGSVPSEPRRPLRADFTAYTLRHAAVARRRAQKKQQLISFIKEPFSMKSLKLLRTVPGAALALAVMATGSVGVYALSNWFGGNVTVKQADPSIFSVDLSSCKGNLPPGVDGPDRSNVQFKILGDPHISAADLQTELLTQCEFDAVLDFYRNQAVTKDYSFTPSTVKAVHADSITLNYTWGGEAHEKNFRLATNATVYNLGQAVKLQDLRAGDKVIFATKPATNWQENVDPLSLTDEVQSIFKTVHDTQLAPSGTKKGFYDENNIMPLDHYNQLKK